MSHTHEFKNLQEFLDACQADCQIPNKERTSHTIGEGKWYGTNSFDKAIDLAQYGWPEGLAYAKKTYKEFEDMLQETEQPKFQPLLDNTGSDVEIDYYLRGEPEDMYEWMPDENNTTKGNKFIHIMVNITATCNVPVHTLFMRGAAIASLIDIFEQQQKRVKLTIGEAVSGYGGQVFTTMINIKNYDDQIDLDQITYTLANASMLRRLIFAWQETQPSKIRDKFGFTPHGSFGYPTEIKKQVQTDSNVTIYIPACDSNTDRTNWKDTNKVRDWVKNKLAEQGITWKTEEDQYA